MTDRLLTINEAAAFLQVTPNYLAKLRVTGGGPAYSQISPRVIRYDKGDLDAWLAGRRRTSTSHADAAA